ncbi:MAG: hypothetical protein WCF26_12070, partial [Candidatus Sulfotelmatobacter sp.]
GNRAQPARFPLFPQPRLLLVSQTTSGNLIVVDRKECLTPDTGGLARAIAQLSKSLFWNILPVTPFDARIWAPPRRSIHSKLFRINILEKVIEKK